MEKQTDNLNDRGFSSQISEKENRKLKAQDEKKWSPLLGIGMFGMIGWTVAVPALLGTALGIWMDKTYHQSFSWTITCLVSGLITGCFVAWNWIIKEE